MAWTLFGFEIRRKEIEQPDDQPVSFSAAEKDDGAIVVEAGGSYGYFVDLEGAAKTEAELVGRYRQMAMQPEIEMAIEEIVNEAIAFDTEGDVVTIDLDDVEFSDGIKNKINEQFEYIRSMLDFNRAGYEIFKRWYVDGRLYYHLIVNEQNREDGIEEMRYVDPRKIRKVREIGTKTVEGVEVKFTKKEYYVYNDRGFGTDERPLSGAVTYKGVKIANDSIVHVTSGLTDKNNKFVLSYLHKAIKPLNQLRAMEDASVIYRLVRAPERRVFNIEVGNLPKPKAEQHVRDVMTRHKNKLVYDASTGEIRDDRKFMTMMEDYWLPKREGQGTTIDTLSAGANLGEMDDVLYFQKKLNQSLNIPVTRLEPSTGFTLGRTSEISRDEVKFSKFVDRLRRRFSNLFLEALRVQLIFKNIINDETWDNIEDKIKIKFEIDNQFAEFKFQELMRERLSVVDAIENYVGKYFSEMYVRKVILGQTNDDIEQMDKEMKEDGSADDFEEKQELERDSMISRTGADEPRPPAPTPREEQPQANNVTEEE